MTPKATTEPATRLRPWRTPRLPELVNQMAAQEILGVSKMQLWRWMQPGSGKGHGFQPDDTYMLPPAFVRSGGGQKPIPVWVRDDVVAFKTHKGRIRAPAGRGKGSIRKAARDIEQARPKS